MFFFFFFLSFLRLWLKIWQGAQPPNKMTFWQCSDFIIPYKILWDWFCKQAACAPIKNFEKFHFFFSFKNVEKLTRQPPASCLTTTHIVMSPWCHAMEDDINISGTLMDCAEYVAYTQNHFRNNHRPLSRLYLEKHQIEVTTPRFSSLYHKSSSNYILNQITEM